MLLHSRPSRPVRALGAVAVAAAVALGIGLPSVGSSAVVDEPRADSADVRVRTVGMFPAATPSGVSADPDTRAVELGTRFRTTVKGRALGVQVYKSVPGRGRTPRRATLWNTRSGKPLASVRIGRRAGTGWVAARFDRPVRLHPGRTYTVSVFAPHGRYSATSGDLATFGSDVLRPAGTSGVYRYGRGSAAPRRTFGTSNYWVDVMFRYRGKRPGGTPKPKPTTTTTPTTPPTVPSTFPNESNTGVPAGVSLTPYAGPMTVTRAGTVIDAASITGNITVDAPGVTISRSSVAGTVAVGPRGSLTITDTRIDIGERAGTGLGEENFVAERIHVTGGNRSINCALDCTVRDSYVHGQYTDTTGYNHESGIRMGIRSTLVHNTIACDAPDVAPEAGCSAPLTGYGDFSPVRDNLIQGNLFLATPAWFCAYGGSSAGKPFSDQASGIRFLANTFQRGTSGKCGRGGPVTDFDPSAPGNVWEGNVYDDGRPARN